MARIYRDRQDPPLWRKQLDDKASLIITFRGKLNYTIVHSDMRQSTDSMLCLIDGTGRIKWYIDSPVERDLVLRHMPDIMAYIIPDFVHGC